MTTLPQTEYRVSLEAFEGPLDLLLFLIRRAEVDISDIPIARIADQYLAHLEAIDRIDIEVAGEFLVMAATLMEIKSRMLRPVALDDGAADVADQDRAADLDSPSGRRGGDAAGDADPRAELVRQLLAYKKYRDAADVLSARLAAWQKRFRAAPGRWDAAASPDGLAADPESAALDMDDLLLADLTEAFARIVQTVDFSRLGEHRIVYDETPIEIHAEDLLLRVREADSGRSNAGERGKGLLSLRQVFAGRSRSDMIGLFLALLELVRQRRVRVEQDAASPDGEIWLAAREPDPEPAPVDARN